MACYIFIQRLMVIRRAGKEDETFMNRIKDYIHEGKVDSALNLCRSTNTPSARMIEKGITRLGRPMNDVLVAIENVGNLEIAKLEKGFPLIATTAAGAPMLGFLGTNECRRNLIVGRYLRSAGNNGRWPGCRYHHPVCLQLSGFAGRQRGKQDGSPHDGIYGLIE